MSRFIRRAGFIKAITLALFLLTGPGSSAIQDIATDTIPPAEALPTTYKVYFLGGQSNMDGHGITDALPDTLSRRVPSIRIFHGQSGDDGPDGNARPGGAGVWDSLAPGHGWGFTSNGIVNRLGNRFGPELAFGHAMAAQAGQSERVALIKYARGATALVHGITGSGSWDPAYPDPTGTNQYDYALQTIASALNTRDIDGDNRTDHLVPAGIIWMQGETDAFDNQAAAESYEANLARLMALLRAAMGVDDLPVVIGMIADSGKTPQTQVMTHLTTVQDAQRRYTQKDSCAALVDNTQTFKFLPDRWHYRSENYVELGTAFARAVSDLERTCGKSRASQYL